MSSRATFNAQLKHCAILIKEHVCVEAAITSVCSIYNWMMLHYNCHDTEALPQCCTLLWQSSTEAVCIEIGSLSDDRKLIYLF